MAEQAGEFDQFAGIVTQIAERKGMPQRVRRDRHVLQAGPEKKAPAMPGGGGMGGMGDMDY